MMELSFGQKVDPDNNLVMPWVTDGCKDWLKKTDLSDKNILMFGAGMGDAWLAKKCKHLTVVERNEEWLHKAANYVGSNGAFVYYIHRPCNEGSGFADFYCEIPNDRKYDIIINDDAYRTEVCQIAVDYFKANGGGILISDNWIQAFVWLSPKAEEIMQPFKAEIFEQADHADHDGINKWKTAVHYIQ
jgi:hypothetical protein